MEDKQYYYKKLDEIYGLIYDTELTIEMTRRTKPQITKEDVEWVKNHINNKLDEITKYEEIY